MINRIAEANNKLAQLEAKNDGEVDFSLISEVLENLEVQLEKNKFGDLDREIKKNREAALEKSMTAEDKEFVEMIDQEYYKRVKTSDEFYRRKKLILKNLEKLQKKVERQAKNYDEYAKLRFIVLEKATQKKSIVKNFVKLENFQTTSSSGHKFFDEGEG